MRILSFFIFLLLAAPHLWSQIQVAAELDSTRILIGDQVRLSLSIVHDPQVRVQSIDWSVIGRQEGIEMIDRGALDTVPSDSELILSQTLTITSFDSGYHWIPAIPVVYSAGGRSDTARTNELPLLVTTFPAADTASLAPIKPILEEPVTFQDVLPFILGGVGLALAILLFLFLRKRVGQAPAPAAAPPRRPPHEVALSRLAALREAQLWQKGEIKTFHSELSHILREYLERRFRFPALESTTEEIAQRLRGMDLDPRWRQELGALFHTADLVKFAKATPPTHVHEEMLNLAERFVRETVEPEPAQEEAVEETDESKKS